MGQIVEGLGISISTVHNFLMFFSVSGKPLKSGEFFDFWHSLTEDEKYYYTYHVTYDTWHA